MHNDEIINLISSTVNISRLLDCEYLLLQAVSYDCVKTVQMYVVSDIITLYTLSIPFSRKILYIPLINLVRCKVDLRLWE